MFVLWNALCCSLLGAGETLCSLRLTGMVVLQQKNLPREVFLECRKWKFVRELFSYKSSLFFNPNFGLKNSPAKALE